MKLRDERSHELGVIGSHFLGGVSPGLTAPLLQALGPVVDGRIGGEHVLVQFKLRANDLNESRDVSSADQVVETKHDLHVLLRNTPSPALRMGDFMGRV
jgi:hypothetical protein